MTTQAKQALLFFTFFAIFFANSTAYAAPRLPENLAKTSLIYCTSVSGFSFNPQKADIGSNMNVVTEQIYDKLIEFDPATNSLKPALAERFNVSEDGLTLTFYLRKNVSFHQTPWFTPTRHFNAEDVLFSLNRVLGEVDELPELNQENQIGTAHHRHQNEVYRKLAYRTHFPYFESIDLKNKIAVISSPSRYVVQIKLHTPDASFLAHLASQYAVILSKEYAWQLNADENLGQLDLLPVGTGVYQLESYEQNDFVRLKPNPRYWGKKAHIENMIVDFSTTGTGRMAKFLNGECDVSAFPEPSQLGLLRETDGYLVETDGANLAFLAFNFLKPRMQALELRQKIAQAINRTRLAQVLFYQTAEVAHSVLPSVLYNEKMISDYRYLAPASTDTPSEPLTLWVIDEKRIYNLHPLKMAEFIRYDLAQAGIEVKIRQVSRAYLVQQLEKGEADYDLILSGWLASNFDPDSFLTPILSCQAQNSVSNLANWCSVEFDALLSAARMSHKEQRPQYYHQIHQLLNQQLPILPLVNVKRSLVVKSKIQHAKISPFGQVKLSEMQLK